MHTVADRMPVSTKALGGLAIALMALCFSLTNAFMVPVGKHSATVTYTPIGVSQPDVAGDSAPRSDGCMTNMAVCGTAVAVALAMGTRSRSVVQCGWRKANTKKVLPQPVGHTPEPTLVVNWQVEEKLPVPGSAAACEAMNGYDVEIGGGKPWDPFGFAKLYDRNFDFNMVMVYPHVQWHREAEIKHGRICMLAFIGMVVQQWWQIPGYPQEPDWTAALDLCYQDPLARLGMGQISIFAMLVEGRWACVDSWIGQMDREPGDLGFDPLNITKTAGFDFQIKQLREIKNGRLAMIGVLSMVSNHYTPGSVPFLTGAF